VSLPTGTPTEFTIRKVELKRELPAKDGRPPKAIVKLGLEAPDGSKGWAESFENATPDSWPKEGSKQTFTLEAPENPNWLPKVKRSRGGGRRRDPAETKAIQRQHSQEMALRWLVWAFPHGVNSDGLAPNSLDDIVEIIDWFDADIANGKAG